MATFCSQCGGELLHDDAHFCTHCGAIQTNRLATSSSFVSANDNLSSGVPPSSDIPPKGAVEQEGKTQDALARNESPERSTQSEPTGYATVMERSNQVDDAASLEQLDFPDLPSAPQSFSPALHAKVWNEPYPLHSLHGLGEDAKPVSPVNKRSMETDRQAGSGVEDLQTRLMESIPSSPQAHFVVDDMPTTPLPISPVERLQPTPVQNIYPQQKPVHTSVDVTDVSHVNTVHLQVQSQSQPSSPGAVPSRSDHPVANINISAPTTHNNRKRLPLIVGSAAVFLLLILALGSWILLLQPFRVSSVTDTQQSFTDTKLGVSLRYPNGWKTPQVDYGKRTILLQDGSDTAQMNVSITNTSNTSAAESPQRYLQKQAAQLGISNPKPGPTSSFANSSWQSIQGDAQVRGAQYTYGLFAMLHNKHLYILTQLAPSSTYTDEEKLVFAPTRLSFHFL